MNIKAMLLASVLSMPLVAGAALAADTGNALVTAAKQGRQADVQSILKSDAKQEIVAAQGGAALIWAAAHNDKAMVDLLLNAGANPKAVNDFGATALYAAADFSDPAVTKSLLAAGADPNLALTSGETPAHVGGPQGQCGYGARTARGRCRPQCEGKERRADRPDVGDGGRLLRRLPRSS